MARTTRTVKPALSHDARDKLLAVLNWPYGQDKQSVVFEQAPFYYEACLEWYQRLSDDDHVIALMIADVMASAHKGAALGMAASLPPAPKCPL